MSKYGPWIVYDKADDAEEDYPTRGAALDRVDELCAKHGAGYEENLCLYFGVHPSDWGFDSSGAALLAEAREQGGSGEHAMRGAWVAPLLFVAAVCLCLALGLVAEFGVWR